MSPPRDLIYIVGTGHSGSTALEMFLTTGRKAVGLGEAWNAVGEELDRLRSRRCSCGADAIACELWAPAVDRMARLTGSSHVERYLVLLERAEELFGREMTLVDSSKRPEGLESLSAARIPGYNVSVLHNVRDVRAHTLSVLDGSVGKGRGRLLPERVFYQWWTRNRQAHAVSTRVLNREPVLVTHERLCLDTDSVARELAHSLGREFTDPHAALNSGVMHSIRGNRVRLPEHAEQAASLRYDDRWRTRSEWKRPYTLLPMVRRYNERCQRAS